MDRSADLFGSNRSAHVRGMAVSGRAAWVDTVQSTVQTGVICTSLLLCLHGADEAVAGPNLVLLVLVVLMAVTIGSPLTADAAPAVRDIVFEWLIFFGSVMAITYATGFAYLFPPGLFVAWGLVTPPLQVVARQIAYRATTHLLSASGERRRTLVVGAGPLGLKVAQRIEQNRALGLELVGFCEDRATDRLPEENRGRVISSMQHAAAVVKEYRIQVVYVTIAAAMQPRNLKMLDDLRDTTASIYFVPDMVLLDLIQPRLDLLDGIPVLAACETPFQGLPGLVKRSFDVVASVLILLAVAPVMLAVTVAIRLDSPGPILFQQRRYGLDGREILIYKFRSMRVVEDGARIVQATRDDDRITPIGRFLRKSSLDELPQFLNVIQGRMSIVGPRPHAVAHNEQYRHVVKGYMVRHKVKPGITGWAQVNGCRGETASVERMAQRIEHDLEYLRRWSLRLDLLIILRTALLVIHDPTAY